MNDRFDFFSRLAGLLAVLLAVLLATFAYQILVMDSLKFGSSGLQSTC